MKHPRIEVENIYVSEIKVLYEDLRNLLDEEQSNFEFINWQPAYDLYVIGERIYISIELPGVDIKDITVYVTQNHLVIFGIKRPMIKEKKTQQIVFHNLEISYGRFLRRIDFPLPVEHKKGDYKLEQGVLTIKFPILKEHIIPIEE
jgi:HSP20 family protein